MPVEPITPGAVGKKKRETFPDAVLEAFNEIIAASCVGGYARFTQDEVVKLMVAKGLKEAEIYNNHWLDVEEVYEKAGWNVEYDRPGYNESYAANFTFTAKRRRS